MMGNHSCGSRREEVYWLREETVQTNKRFQTDLSLHLISCGLSLAEELLGTTGPGLEGFSCHCGLFFLSYVTK